MNIIEMVFINKQEMNMKMEKGACKYEGYVTGRIGYNYPTEKGYVIAYIKGDTLTKLHELKHAKYYYDASYRDQVNKLWSSFSDKEQTIITKFLNRCGYPQKVYLDEFQAYWYTEKDPRKFFGLKRA